MATVMAHCKLRSLAAASSNNELKDSCDTLMLEMAKAYRASSVAVKASWTYDGDEEWKWLRRTCIAIGRDMVQNGAEMGMSCQCCYADENSELDRGKMCPLRLRLVGEGVEFLRAAAGSEERLVRFAAADAVLSQLFSGVPK